MSEVVLNAIKRENTGKKYAKQLRRNGKIPGIFYSHKEKNIPLIFDINEIHHLMSTEIGLLDIKIDNKRSQKCIIKEIQLDPVSHQPLHLDVMGVKLKEKISVSVPIHITGEALGVKEEGGTLSQSLYELEISCLPLDLPEHIDVDVTNLKLGDTIHVEDLQVENVDIITDPEVVVAGVTITRAALEEEVKPVEPTVEEEEESEESTQEADKES